jgi:hypothetical protein
MPIEGSIDPTALDNRLQRAASRGDARDLALAYRMAAERADHAGRTDEAGFFLTHAYVWALVAGETPLAEPLARALRHQGRLD